MPHIAMMRNAIARRRLFWPINAAAILALKYAIWLFIGQRVLEARHYCHLGVARYLRWADC